MILTWVKIGVRSLGKNKRRSCFTIGAVALGFAAVNLFGGYTAYIFKGMEEGYVHAYANGHLGIFKRGFLAEGSLRPTDFMLSDDEIERIRQVCLTDERIVLASPQLAVAGLVSNGRVSTIFAALGRVPSDIEQIRARATSFVGKLKMFDGTPLDENAPYGVGMSRGLAQKLDMGLGSEPIVLANTADGQMNALDAQVLNLFDAAYEVLDDKLMDFPLTFARELYDTGGADRMIVLLADEQQTRAVVAELGPRLAQAGLDVEIRDWQQLCDSYTRIRDMFNVMFSFLFIIVFVIVVLSVVNTISMAVFERTREIGTLRALGLKRHGVLIMFAAESGLLGLMGSALGLALTLAAWVLLKLVRPEWTPPIVTRRVPFEVYLVPEYLLLSLVFLVLLAVGAALVPARRAARMQIIDALGHV